MGFLAWKCRDSVQCREHSRYAHNNQRVQKPSSLVGRTITSAIHNPAFSLPSFPHLSCQMKRLQGKQQERGRAETAMQIPDNLLLDPMVLFIELTLHYLNLKVFLNIYIIFSALSNKITIAEANQRKLKTLSHTNLSCH